MRGSHPGHLALDVKVDRYATTPNHIQQPTPVHYPDYPAWNGTAYMGQQRRRMAQPDFVQPYASTSYSFEPQHPSEKVSNTVPPRSIITTFSSPAIEPEPEPTPYSASASQFSLPSHAQRPFSNLTSASADPFFLDNLILGPAATQNPQGEHRPQSPAHPSTRSSSVSIGTFPLPPTPQTPLQFDVSQALASLREPTSPAILSQRNPPSPSSIRTFSTARRPRFDLVVDEPTPSPRSITSGYFMYPPPQDDIQLQPSQSFTKAPSIRTTGSNPGEPVSCLSTQDSRLTPSPERELDGVHYSRDDYTPSPALPDSVRTSVLSCSERI
ncbi:hypothetical protein FRC12_002525 [Ceratobasidium sp. 428]|nr:hypothetical protein FRC12_002525 [Ceratobasidium sp. 428]